MKKLLIGALFISSCLFVSADSYDGPFCYEPASQSNKESEDPQARDDRNVRGTCKKIEFRKFYELDSSLRNDYSFLFVQTTEEPSLELYSTTSPVIKDESYGMKYGSGSSYLVLNSAIGTYCSTTYEKYVNKGNILGENYQEHRRAYEEVQYCLTQAAYRLSEIFNFDKIKSADSMPDQNDFDGLVSITSPIMEYNQYWVIKKAPSGKIYRENIRSEEVLDNGTIKMLTKEAPQSDVKPPRQEGFFARLAAFFRNLF